MINIRLPLLRYVNTNSVSRREISSKIRRRFPTIRHIVDSGLMTEKEFELLNKISSEVKNVRWMTPLHWVQQILADEIKDNAPMASLTNQFVQELKQYRSALRKLFCHDWVCVPLVYTQVAALATYAYFAFCLLGRQFLDPEKKYKRYEIDFVVPIFTIVQWMESIVIRVQQVGQDLMRPFGMDDDDIELDYIFERNVATSFAIVNRLQMTDYGLSCQTKQHRPVRHVPSYQPINRDDVEDGNARCAAILKKWKGYELVSFCPSFCTISQNVVFFTRDVLLARRWVA
uniref:Bestrophin homolog n=1 Tax=Parascaris equorum TaxID=6256 RepID=A0A914S009_PAREQ